jgi:hypothetical protein
MERSVRTFASGRLFRGVFTVFFTATPARHAWTAHAATCRDCGRRFRISADAWGFARELEPGHNTAELLEGFDLCLGCTGDTQPAEYIVA